LHLAAAAYWCEACDVLFGLGAKPNAVNRRGAAPLHYAVDGGPGMPHWNPPQQAAVVARLIAAGAAPDLRDKSGVTPLHRAVRTRCTLAVRALLEHGADVRAPNGSGSTPLHLAVQTTGRGGSGADEARAEQEAIVTLLLAHGARPGDEDGKGKTVADLATRPALAQLLAAAS
jgi:ankyrin repeat protein